MVLYSYVNVLKRVRQHSSTFYLFGKEKTLGGGGYVLLLEKQSKGDGKNTMRITVRQLKGLIREAVEDATSGGFALFIGHGGTNINDIVGVFETRAEAEAAKQKCGGAGIIVKAPINPSDEQIAAHLEDKGHFKAAMKLKGDTEGFASWEKMEADSDAAGEAYRAGLETKRAARAAKLNNTP